MSTGVFWVVDSWGKVFAFFVDFLNCVPGILVDHWFGVVFYFVSGDVQFSQVEAVGEICGVGVEAFEESTYLVDFVVWFATGAHFPGAFATVPPFGIGYPAVDDMGASIPACADVDRFSFEAAWGEASQCSVLFEEVALSSFYVDTHVFYIALVHPVDGGFEEASVWSIGDVVVYGVDQVSTAAQVGAKKLGVVDVTGESVVFPENDACFGGVVAEVFDHLVELISAYG